MDGEGEGVRDRVYGMVQGVWLRAGLGVGRVLGTGGLWYGWVGQEGRDEGRVDRGWGMVGLGYGWVRVRLGWRTGWGVWGGARG